MLLFWFECTMKGQQKREEVENKAVFLGRREHCHIHSRIWNRKLSFLEMCNPLFEHFTVWGESYLSCPQTLFASSPVLDIQWIIYILDIGTHVCVDSRLMLLRLGEIYPFSVIKLCCFPGVTYVVWYFGLALNPVMLSQNTSPILEFTDLLEIFCVGL